MADHSAAFDQLELACKALKASAAIPSWEWDGRFQAALAVYQAAGGAEIQGVLGEHFSAKWNAANIADAPTDLRRLVKTLGGFRAGQDLGSSDPSLDLFVAVALWPWGGGAQISIRLWLLSGDLPAEESGSLQERFRGWFL